MAREIGPAPGAAAAGQPLSEGEMRGMILRFALIDAIGVVALLAFLVAYFVYDVWPARPTWMLVVAIVAFAAWAFLAMKVSGFLRMLGQKRSTDAR